MVEERKRGRARSADGLIRMSPARGVVRAGVWRLSNRPPPLFAAAHLGVAGGRPLLGRGSVPSRSPGTALLPVEYPVGAAICRLFPGPTLLSVDHPVRADLCVRPPSRACVSKAESRLQGRLPVGLILCVRIHSADDQAQSDGADGQTGINKERVRDGKKISKQQKSEAQGLSFHLNLTPSRFSSWLLL